MNVKHETCSCQKQLLLIPFINVYIYIYIYMYIHIYNIYIYIIYCNIYCTVNMGLKLSEKSVFLPSFGCGSFQGNSFSFEKQVVTKDFT